MDLSEINEQLDFNETLVNSNAPNAVSINNIRFFAEIIFKNVISILILLIRM